jgi:hypothetical protein
MESLTQLQPEQEYQTTAESELQQRTGIIYATVWRTLDLASKNGLVPGMELSNSDDNERGWIVKVSLGSPSSNETINFLLALGFEQTLITEETIEFSPTNLERKALTDISPF